jgi:subtilisin-like proprotein convertase family protein
MRLFALVPSAICLFAAPASAAEKNIGPEPVISPQSTIEMVPMPIQESLDAASMIVSSTDVPKSIPENDPTGITSVLQGPSMTISDVNLVIDSLPHTCVPDLHIELTSPSGTTAVLIKSFSENGIFMGVGCPGDFWGTSLDDQAVTNLLSGAAPFTGAFNVEHSSVVALPLTAFNGEDAAGTWTLSVSDRASADTGTLEGWSIEFNGSSSESCILDAQLAYVGGNFDVNFDIGTLGPATWNAQLVIFNTFIPLISEVPLPAIDPPISVPISFPLPSLGTVGVLTTLVDSNGIACDDWETVYTGSAP